MATLPPAVAPDPSQRVVSCEVCGTVTTIGASHSFIIAMAYATTGGQYSAFRCDSEQHFACCQACAVKAAHACIEEHLIPKYGRITAAQGA